VSNPPKPIEQKRKIGNPGKRALPSLASVSTLPAAVGIPDPLRPLGQEGKRMWDRIWAGAAAWVAPTTDIELVQLACEAMDERIALRVAVLRGSDWRDRVALRSIEHDLRTMLSALGMTPVDRTRMGVAEVRGLSKLEALQARAAQR
jgi:hypothetical protein